MIKVINSQEELIEAVKITALETSKMARKIFGKTFPINSLTIFTHSQPEYNEMVEIISKIGKPYNFNNGPRVELNKPIEVGKNFITHLRIRKPDSERPQIGCNDFETDYVTFKNAYLLRHTDNLKLIKRKEYEMIEIHDNKFNVLAYVVSK